MVTNGQNISISDPKTNVTPRRGNYHFILNVLIVSRATDIKGEEANYNNEEFPLSDARAESNHTRLAPFDRDIITALMQLSPFQSSKHVCYVEVSDEENKHELIVYETFLILRNTDVNPILMISGSLSATRSDIAHLRVAGRLRYISPGLGSSGGEWRVVS